MKKVVIFLKWIFPTCTSFIDLSNNSNFQHNTTLTMINASTSFILHGGTIASVLKSNFNNGIITIFVMVLLSLLTCLLSILVFFCFNTSRRFTRRWLVSSQSLFFSVSTPRDALLVVDLSPLNPCFFFVSTPRDALLVVDLSLLAVMYKLLSEKKTKFPTHLFHSRSSFCRSQSLCFRRRWPFPCSFRFRIEIALNRWNIFCLCF